MVYPGVLFASEDCVRLVSSSGTPEILVAGTVVERCEYWPGCTCPNDDDKRIAQLFQTIVLRARAALSACHSEWEPFIFSICVLV